MFYYVDQWPIPDVTGKFYDTGETYGGYPTYRRGGEDWWIWKSAGGRWWLSDQVGNTFGLHGISWQGPYPISITGMYTAYGASAANNLEVTQAYSSPARPSASPERIPQLGERARAAFESEAPRHWDDLLVLFDAALGPMSSVWNLARDGLYSGHLPADPHWITSSRSWYWSRRGPLLGLEASQYVDVPFPAELNYDRACTVLFHARHPKSSPPASAAVLDLGEQDAGGAKCIAQIGWGLSTESHNGFFVYHGGDTSYGRSASSAVDVSEWHWYAVVFPGGDVAPTIYVDGASNSAAYSATNGAFAADVFQIGTASGLTGSEVLLDHFRLYTRALAAGEIGEMISGSAALLRTRIEAPRKFRPADVEEYLPALQMPMGLPPLVDPSIISF